MNQEALIDLDGRVAVVSGGNGGIGRGIALGLQPPVRRSRRRTRGTRSIPGITASDLVTGEVLRVDRDAIR